MDKQKQIEEMAQCKNSYGITCNECHTKACDRYALAEELYNAGYRKESDTAREILTAIKEDKSGYWDSCDCGKEELHWRDKCVEDTLRMIAEKYGVDLGNSNE
jgi:hypothetical protein